jgi:hypothetical protein
VRLYAFGEIVAGNLVYPKLPILLVLKEALLCPIKNVGRVALTALVGIVFIALALVALAVWIPSGHSEVSIFRAMPGVRAFVYADVPGRGGSEIVVPNMVRSILSMFFLGAVYIAVGVGFFNYWIRTAVMGPRHLLNGGWKTLLASIVPSAVMFFFAGLTIGVIFFLLQMAVTSVAPMAATSIQSFVNSLASVAIVGIAISTILTFLSCSIFAFWSPTLVEIALGQRYVSSRNPRKDAMPSQWRMAVVLTTIVLGTDMLFWLIDTVFGTSAGGLIGIAAFFFAIAVAGAAHGVAFRLSTGRTGPLAVSA